MRATQLYSLSCRLLHDFFRARGGNVTITAAFASIALIGFVGAAVDYSRANSLKAAMQAALDATTLKLGREYFTLTGTQLQNQGDLIFSAIFTRPEAKNPTITVVRDQANATIQATGSAATGYNLLGRCWGLSLSTSTPRPPPLSPRKPRCASRSCSTTPDRWVKPARCRPCKPPQKTCCRSCKTLPRRLATSMCRSFLSSKTSTSGRATTISPG